MPARIPTLEAWWHVPVLLVLVGCISDFSVSSPDGADQAADAGPADADADAADADADAADAADADAADAADADVDAADAERRDLEPPAVCDNYASRGEVYDCTQLNVCAEDFQYRLACCECDARYCMPGDEVCE